uniref:DNA polymerase III subunit chi n=1 Tax=Altererythrobacter segetis TaxID=1104773 RepID=UPI0014079042|nr:DNA polymerase III subunit chi [Altererythrobacter segetis]
MQLDFWQLSRDPVERVVALIGERTRGAGERLLVVAEGEEQRAAMSRALWEAKAEAFLANGEVAAPHAERQPILLSAECQPVNGARYAVLADGVWRDEAEQFERVFLLFGEAGTEAARGVWRQFDGREDVQRSYFAQEDGKWVKKA